MSGRIFDLSKRASPAPSLAPRSALAKAHGAVRDVLLAPLYRLYTDRLRREVRHSALPAHVAVILDGNRRWASEAGLAETGAGHRQGADKLDELLAWCAALKIPEVTVWALSNENLERRTESELDALLGVVADKLEALTERAVDPTLPLQIRVYGRLDELPERLRRAVARAQASTPPAPPALKLNIALAYSGRDEIVDACRRLIESLAARGIPPEEMGPEISRSALAAHLYTAGERDPDLIIRTSGELRLSGFLPWQSAHSEFYFTDVYWPAFRELDFLRALRTYQQRQRRFGG